MDELDQRLLAALKRDGRASLSELAADLGVTRTTVRARIAAMQRATASAREPAFETRSPRTPWPSAIFTQSGAGSSRLMSGKVESFGAPAPILDISLAKIR